MGRLLHGFHRQVRLTLVAVDDADVEIVLPLRRGIGPVGQSGNGVLVGLDRLIVLPQPLVGNSQVAVSHVLAGIDFRGPSKSHRGGLVVLGHEELSPLVESRLHAGELLLGGFPALALLLHGLSFFVTQLGQGLLSDFGQVEVQRVLVSQLDLELLVMGHRVAVDGQDHLVEGRSEPPDRVAPLLVGLGLVVLFDLESVQADHGSFQGLSILADDLSGKEALGRQGSRQQQGCGGQQDEGWQGAYLRVHGNLQRRILAARPHVSPGGAPSFPFWMNSTAIKPSGARFSPR